ncbi:MAG TPA: hypothetical protein VF189_02610 [Patescibacteria group bacterium]
MVDAESGKGQEPTHSPTNDSQRLPFGYTPSSKSTEYSPSGEKPPFGLAPIKHIYPQQEIIEESGPFGMPIRKKAEFDKDAKGSKWLKLDAPKRIPNGGRRRRR